MDYWDIDEALLLSRGISPDKWNNNLNEPYLNQEHMDIVTDDINNRFKILKKALNFNGIYYREILCLYDGEENYKEGFFPEVFSVWAKNKLQSFPEILYEAVMKSLVVGSDSNPDDAVHVRIKDLCEWAMKNRYHLPDELKALIPNDDPVAPQNDKKLRPDQLAKIKCQAIAQTLWHLYSEMTIEDMKKHYAIREIGDGKSFQGKNTLRDWLSEVDPRPDDEKPGPKKASA
jgi:hypothetical protein